MTRRPGLAGELVLEGKELRARSVVKRLERPALEPASEHGACGLLRRGMDGDLHAPPLPFVGLDNRDVKPHLERFLLGMAILLALVLCVFPIAGWPARIEAISGVPSFSHFVFVRETGFIERFPRKVGVFDKSPQKQMLLSGVNIGCVFVTKNHVRVRPKCLLPFNEISGDYWPNYLGGGFSVFRLIGKDLQHVEMNFDTGRPRRRLSVVLNPECNSNDSWLVRGKIGIHGSCAKSVAFKPMKLDVVHQKLRSFCGNKGFCVELGGFSYLTGDKPQINGGNRQDNGEGGNDAIEDDRPPLRRQTQVALLRLKVKTVEL